MNFSKILIALAICLIPAFVLHSQDNSVIKSGTTRSKSIDAEPKAALPDEIAKKCAKFFETLINKQVETAFSELMVGSPLNQRQEELQKLIFETKKANKLYGDIKAYESVNFESVTSSLMRVRFLGYHDTYPMRWIITFYKAPSNGWIVTNLKFDDMSENFFIAE